MLDFYLKQVRQELFARGVWGHEARRIATELSDHYLSDVEERIRGGGVRETAERESMLALGSASDVAKSAADEIRHGSWLARHPLMTGAGFFVGALIGTALICTAISYLGIAIISSSTNPVTQTSMAHVFEALFNWLPLVAGCLWLAWWARRSTGSWMALICASVAIGLASSLMFTKISPPIHGPGSGAFYLVMNGWSGLIAWIVSELFPATRPFSTSLTAAVGPNSLMLRTVLPVAIVLAFRFLMPRVRAQSSS